MLGGSDGTGPARRRWFAAVRSTSRGRRRTGQQSVVVEGVLGMTAGDGQVVLSAQAQACG